MERVLAKQMGANAPLPGVLSNGNLVTGAVSLHECVLHIAMGWVDHAAVHRSADFDPGAWRALAELVEGLVDRHVTSGP